MPLKRRTNILAVVDKRHIESGNLKKIDPLPHITHREVMELGNEVILLSIPASRNQDLLDGLDKMVKDYRENEHRKLKE